MQWWCAAQDTAWSWTWRAYPGVWLFVAALAAGFVTVHRRFPGRDADFKPAARRGFAAAGGVLLWIALDWPVGALGSGYLASVHMVQFLLIAVAAPPLLLLGVPTDAWRAALTRPGVNRLARVAGHPIFALASFTAIMGFTHWPVVVDSLMAGQAGSFVLDMLWLLSGLTFWWPVAVALPERDWLREPFKIGYLIAATLVNTGVFAFLTFSDVPVYATFELAPPVGSLSTRDDQLLSGLLMKVGGALILWASISILFFRWFRRSEREDAAERRIAGTITVLALAGVVGCGPAGTSLDGPVLVGEPLTPDRAALYLTLVGGRDDDRLLGVRVEGATASLHRTSMADGMMRMEPVDGGLGIPAGEYLRLRPGGAHVMLEGIESDLVAGDSLRVTFLLDSGALGAWARVVPLTELESLLAR